MVLNVPDYEWTVQDKEYNLVPGNPAPAELAAANANDTSSPSGITALKNDSATSNTTNSTVPAYGTFRFTDGGYVTIACIFGIATADTKIGPLVLGVLTIGLIYQLTLLIQGK